MAYPELIRTNDELKAENAHLRDVIDEQRQTIVMLARMLTEAQRPATRNPLAGAPPTINIPSYTVPHVSGESV